MTFQYGDLRVDQLTYTSGSANQTVTVSGLVQQVTAGGTTSGNVRIEGDLVVTGEIQGDTITGNTISAVTGNFDNISGTNLTYENGTISGLVVQNTATITGDANVIGTITGLVVTASTGQFTTLTGLTTTGTTANFTTGNFQVLSGDTVTGNTFSGTSGVFTNLSGQSLVVSGLEITGSINLPDTVTGVSGLFTFVSGNTITGNTINGTTGNFITVNTTNLFADNAQISGNLVVTGDVTATNITGTTITGTTVNATTGTFQTILGPISSTTVTGVTRVATAAEAESAAGPSGTYTTAASGNINSPFLINPVGLSGAFRAYDPPIGGNPGTGVFARVVITTGVAPDFGIESITWSGINLSANIDAVTDLQATSAVRPSGTYGVAPSGNANSEFFYNPVQLEKTFKAYDPVATAAEDQLYARIVSGTSDGQGGFNTTSYGWIQVPTGTPSIATEAQAQAAAGASGTYSEVPTAANLPNLINPNRLRSALQAYDPGIISGERRVYARVVSGITDTTADYEWLNVTDSVAGNFLPLSGGTVTGFTAFTSGMRISGNVTMTGTFTQSGSHTSSGAGSFYNCVRTSNAGQVLYQINNSAGRGIYQGDHAGVAFSKGGSGVAEFTVTGDKTFAVISGDLRVGNDNENVSDANSSQFWALSGGQFISAFSTDESVVWKDATQGEILRLQSNVGGQRTSHFQFTASGALGLSGEFGTNGQVLTSRGTTTGVHWTSLPGQGGTDGFFDNLFISGDATITGDLAVSGSSTFNTVDVTGVGVSALTVSGRVTGMSGLCFGTYDGAGEFGMIYATAGSTNSPNLYIGTPNELAGATTRNTIGIGAGALNNASADSDRNIAIGNAALEDMSDGHQNVAIGHAAMQNIRPGNNQGANTAIGDQALFGGGANNNNSRNNVAIGRAALFDGFQARQNVVIGTQAGFDLTTVTGNVIIGTQAAFAATDVNNNVVIGSGAGFGLSTGDDNLFLGAGAGSSVTDGSRNTIIGSIAATNVADTVIIGAGTTERLRITNAGNVQIPSGGDPTIELNADGSAVFADGEVTIATDGDTIISGDLQVGPNTLIHENGTTQQNESLVTATAFDMSSGTFYCVSGAIAVPNPTNQLAGQAGIMRLITAPPASFGNNFNFPGGGAPNITGVSATTNTIIPFYVPAAGTIICGTPIQNISGTNSLGTQVDRGGGGGLPGMTLSTTAWVNGGTIPGQFTQNGGAGQNNDSPPWVFSNLPAGTTSGRFQCLDTSANNFIHWNVSGIPAISLTGIGQNEAAFPGVPTTQVGNVGTFVNPTVPPGTNAGPFLCRTNGWGGPSPGGNTNTYVFTLTAQNAAGADIATATYTGTFV